MSKLRLITGLICVVLCLLDVLVVLTCLTLGVPVEDLKILILSSFVTALGAYLNLIAR